jgi:hypothetical protein
MFFDRLGVSIKGENIMNELSHKGIIKFLDSVLWKSGFAGAFEKDSAYDPETGRIVVAIPSKKFNVGLMICLTPYPALQGYVLTHFSWDTCSLSLKAEEMLEFYRKRFPAYNTGTNRFEEGFESIKETCVIIRCPHDLEVFMEQCNHANEVFGYRPIFLGPSLGKDDSIT